MATSYKDSLICRYAAEAGINLAVAYLRDLARTDFNAPPLNNWANSGISGVLSGGRNTSAYHVKITDTASQININDPNSNLRSILANLADVIGSPLSTSDGEAIVDNRPAGGYLTKEEIIQCAGYDRPKYEAIKDYITTDGYIDNNSDDSTHGSPYSPKSPVNINTASEEVLRAVLMGVITSGKAQSLATAIVTYRSSTQFTKWSQFDNLVETAPFLDPADIEKVKFNANPNRTKPAVYSTDFCLHPGGYYEIVSTGLAGIDGNGDGDLNDGQDIVRAQRNITSLVKIYGILNQTSKGQFQGDDGDAEPVAFKVNTYDSCPVEPIDATGSGERWEGTGSVNYPASGDYKAIPDSVKNGFWDNFDDSYLADGSMFYVNGAWRQAGNANRTAYLWKLQSDDHYTIANEDGDSDQEIYSWASYIGKNNSPMLFLGPASGAPDDLKWYCYTVRSTVDDRMSTYMKCQTYNPILLDEFDFTKESSTTHYAHLPDSSGDTWHRMEQANLLTDTSDAESWRRVNTDFTSGIYAGSYHKKNTMITSLPTTSNSYFYAYEAGTDPDGFSLYYAASNPRTALTGRIGWQMKGAINTIGLRPSADNIRIIAKDESYFISRSLAVDEAASWGTIGASVTLSTGAAVNDLDRVEFQTSVDDGATWQPAALPGVLPGGKILSSGAASNIRYRANFVSSDIPGVVGATAPYLSETIALEDVTITYLPRAKVIYCRETL